MHKPKIRMCHRNLSVRTTRQHLELCCETAVVALVVVFTITLPIEKNYIQHVLDYAKRSKTQASRILEISRPTLDKKIKDYNLEV